METLILLLAGSPKQRYRKDNWATAPRPVHVEITETDNHFAGRVWFWEDRKNRAAAGNPKDLLGADGITVLATAVRLYGEGEPGQSPGDVQAALQVLMRDFPDTLIAQEAQRQMDQAKPEPGSGRQEPGTPKTTPTGTAP